MSVFNYDHTGRNPTTWDHIIWDWNGTLLDDAWLCVEIMNGMLAARGLEPLTLARYQDVFDFPVRDYYARVGFNFAREPFEQLSDEFMAGYRGRIRECGLREGTREVLERARARGITQSILSAMETTLLLDLLDHFGLRDTFTAVIGLTDHHAAGKVEEGRRWLASQTIAPARMLYIGDTTHDHEVAEALGVVPVFIASGHHSRARLMATGGRVITALAEVFA